MSFTFDITTNVGKLRAEIGDVNEAEAMFSDEELEYFLTKANGDLFEAKIIIAENRCMVIGNNAGIEILEGDARIKTSGDAGNNWCSLAKEWRLLKERGGNEGCDPFYYTGGIYLDDRKQNEQDIIDDVVIQRDFYDNYNDEFPSGKIIENGER